MNDKSTLFSQLRQASRNYSDNTVFMHEAIAESIGLSNADHKYLGLLVERGMMTSGQLAAATGLSTGAITGVVDRLEKRGFVKRVFSKEDRRKVFIKPQETKIEELVAPIFLENKNQMDVLLSRFDEDELKAITKYLDLAGAFMKNRINQLKSNK